MSSGLLTSALERNREPGEAAKSMHASIIVALWFTLLIGISYANLDNPSVLSRRSSYEVVCKGPLPGWGWEEEQVLGYWGFLWTSKYSTPVRPQFSHLSELCLEEKQMVTTYSDDGSNKKHRPLLYLHGATCNDDGSVRWRPMNEKVYRGYASLLPDGSPETIEKYWRSWQIMIVLVFARTHFDPKNLRIDFAGNPVSASEVKKASVTPKPEYRCTRHPTTRLSLSQTRFVFFHNAMHIARETRTVVDAAGYLAFAWQIAFAEQQDLRGQVVRQLCRWQELILESEPKSEAAYATLRTFRMGAATVQTALSGRAKPRG
ncbi:MAG: hypothetical protein M1814_005836 [Vezdaea aestivalis]|nr:MAG: hypothetical protein M1814_005836 [Vezdaea aestivalis]